jgi:hypothetical protein
MDKTDLKFEDEQNTISPDLNSFMHEKVFEEDSVVQKKAIITANILYKKITGMCKRSRHYMYQCMCICFCMYLITNLRGQEIYRSIYVYVSIYIHKCYPIHGKRKILLRQTFCMKK